MPLRSGESILVPEHGESRVACVGMYIHVCTWGKGIRFCNPLEKQLLQSVKCQKRLNQSSRETYRREQSCNWEAYF